jgi:transposase
MIGLPSLRALDSAPGPRIWMCAEAVDMRWGFDRLAELVRTGMGQDPFGAALFFFSSRRRDRMKILYWDGDGYVLVYKRLERGVFKLPVVAAGTRAVELRRSEMAMILDGVDVSKVKWVQRYVRVGMKEEREKTTSQGAG